MFKIFVNLIHFHIDKTCTCSYNEGSNVNHIHKKGEFYV